LRPIRKGDRGAAVEDVQRRLISLGADLGPTGVDGVFLGATRTAVRAFQRARDLHEDGEVGPQTWAALVDATFALGDRLIYLRYPYLHGEDVRVVQSALNALGFASGDVDGIFGAFTERAVRDFQANTGIAVDGVVGPDTVRALDGLRHAWSGRSCPPPSELRASPARIAAVLRGRRVVIVCDGATQDVAGRLANLALASEAGADVRVASGERVPADGLVVELAASAPPGVTALIAGPDGAALADGVAAAVAAGDGAGRWVVVIAGNMARDDHAVQAMAVSLLDGLCQGLVGS
jgi:peptidoglycan hydrolase-like protein with peptidoglycan-binding domain